MSKVHNSFTDRTWTLAEAPSHPLALKYRISERQFRRAVQSRRIGFARPGGLVVRLTHEDIVLFVESSFQASYERGASND